ncbi:MAG: hypothetical protein CL930_00980 [Deltaproteobacteria bacterium]|nr:hypothetical protein [Deltaproteobacteria bacterium]
MGCIPCVRVLKHSGWTGLFGYIRPPAGGYPPQNFGDEKPWSGPLYRSISDSQVKLAPKYPMLTVDLSYIFYPFQVEARSKEVSQEPQ